MFNLKAQPDLPTVLLIDDDMVSREVIATVLTMSGYSVHTAEGGRQALRLIADRACVPGVILMDAQMPGLAGTHLIQALRAQSRAVIYVLSGSSASREVIDAADGFLLKPISPDEPRNLLKEHEKRVALPPAANPDAAVPVVDPEILAQLRDMMPEASVRQIYAAVVADLFKRLAALELAVQAHDLPEIHRIGHAIKGGCAMAGASRAARLGAALEDSVNHLDNSSPSR